MATPADTATAVATAVAAAVERLAAVLERLVELQALREMRSAEVDVEPDDAEPEDGVPDYITDLAGRRVVVR